MAAATSPGPAARPPARWPGYRRCARPTTRPGWATDADTAELLATATDLALAAGWVHAAVYLDGEPRRFTIRECIHRHRLRGTG
ncbi:MAG TPA: hypothetical protein VFX70_20500 [Mycobacteriales bacterium]|nr:hypothetical protein [Mycobacteriales bacterium]